MDHVLRGLAANPNLPGEFLSRLVAVAADDELVWVLAERADLTPEHVATLAAKGESAATSLAREGRLTADDVDPEVWPDTALALLYAGRGRPEWARRFASDPDPRRRESLAECPGLPDDVVERLAADPDVGVVTELALWAPAETAARLAAHPHAEVRSAVAYNLATPPEVLARLASSEGLPPARHCLVCDRHATPFVHDPYCPHIDCMLPPGASCDGSHESTVHTMYMRASENPGTPIGAVAHFAAHQSMLLRCAVAARADLPPDACQVLAADPMPGVREDLAANPAIGEAVMRRLAADASPDVRRGVALNPLVPLDLLAELTRTAKIGPVLLPRVADASPDEVADLAASPNPVLRMLVAQRRDLPPPVRDRLADDTDAKVLFSIAPHPGLSGRQLHAMLDRHGSRVAAAVAANPDAPAALLEAVTAYEPPARKALRAVAAHSNATPAALCACLDDTRARRIALTHPALPPHLVAALVAGEDEAAAEAAAAHPALPRRVMAELLARGGALL
ncbi:hypothetical protein [Yinghuangia seranimata]|uniref:hypothetical protein n=1 Tax=Yinghuangia seranimata TaxID=408067 RepID=UPI00248B0EF6|nr:hypothetical protein [Yinghuangia seranimata]MDI2125718.1 hypothetical protein [Yinghuangia seranimata]